MKRKFILLPITLTALAPNISLVGCGKKEHDYSKDYLTFTALTDGYFECDINKEIGLPEVKIDLWYSINNSDWKQVLCNDIDEEKFNYKYLYYENDVIRLKGDNNYFSYCVGNEWFWETSLHFKGLVNASGNIMSLLYGDDFVGKTNLKCDGVFYGLFCGHLNQKMIFSQILNANNLILPATKLTYSCYHDMFGYCSMLSTIPVLPAENLNIDCYQRMFAYCENLSQPSKLLAKLLCEGCYQGMFMGCSSLSVNNSGNKDHLFFECPENVESSAVTNMFFNTYGPYTDDPKPGEKYYWVN